MLSELSQIRDRITDPHSYLEGRLGILAPALNDWQRATLRRICDMVAFQKLEQFEILRREVAAGEYVAVLQGAYPQVEWRLPDMKYWVTSLPNLVTILNRNWVSELEWTADLFDCDDFAALLYSHLTYYWGINSVLPVWGDTDRGYHAFNAAVLWHWDKLVARLIEPQTDAVFEKQGPLGNYVPREFRQFLGAWRPDVRLL